MGWNVRQSALQRGYRSGLEEDVADSLRARDVSFTFEEMKLTWHKPATKHTYTPDFVITTASGKQIIIETKGRWLAPDRQKMKHVVEQHPDLDIRMVFTNPNARLSKVSKTTYAIWCQTKLAIPWAGKDIPNEWILE